MSTNCCLKNIMAIRFCIWDLHLYLDTHPDDEEKLALLRSYEEKYNAMLPEFERTYGPISSASGCRWVETPFPWEKGGAC